MTPIEFKAWFDGFTEAFTGVPTKAQWTRVKERVAEIDGKAVTERVFVDRYWPTYYPPIYRRDPPPYWATYTNTSNNSGQAAPGSVGSAFQPTSAMYALGKADAISVT